MLQGRVALVTGAGRNIGRAIALALAGQGAHVVLNARASARELEETAREAQALGVQAFPLLADVGEPEQVEGLARRALETFGKVDILVHNAAIRPHRPFLEMDYQEWRRVLAVDLDAAFLLTRLLLPGMVAQGWGRVITIGGMLAFEGHAGWAHVSAAKMGLLGLTRALGRELAPYGVLVNCIVPGAIATPSTQAAHAERLKDIPAGRLGTPQDIAALCLFLCSEGASFITGQAIHINGGERCH